MAEAESSLLRSCPSQQSLRRDRRRLPRVQSQPKRTACFLAARSLPPVLSFSSTHLFVCTSLHKRLFSPLVCFVSFFIVSPTLTLALGLTHFPFRYCSLAAASLSLSLLCRFLFLAFSVIFGCPLHSPIYIPLHSSHLIEAASGLQHSTSGVLCNSFLKFSFIPFALHIHDNHVITKTPPR